MTKFRSDAGSWIETGKKAAEAGRTGQALFAVFTLFKTVFAGIETIIENQFELEKKLQAVNAAKPAAAVQNGR